MEGVVNPPRVALVDADGSRALTSERVRAAVRDHHAGVFRLLRRLGVPESGADDAVQQVYCVFARRAFEVAPDKEKAFLFGTALRVARAARRKPGDTVESCDEVVLEGIPAPTPGSDVLLDDHRARALLDALLASMPDDLRAVFVLHEIEEMTAREIASVLAVPSGTVASRLRRARALFEHLSRRLQAELAASGRGR